MYTLKELCIVKLASELYNDPELKNLLRNEEDETREHLIRKKLPISFQLQEEVVARMKPIEFEARNWIIDHIELFTVDQIWSIDLIWNSDGTVDRVETVDSLLRSTCLDDQTRFILACHYWYITESLQLFKQLSESAKKRILKKYSKKRMFQNYFEENVKQWIENYQTKSLTKCPSYRCWFETFNWTDVSMQSRLLYYISGEQREDLLHSAFLKTVKVPFGRFCLSRMSEDFRKLMLIRFPLKVLRIYLFLPYLKLFLNVVKDVWNYLSVEHFICLLHIIICQKIVALWKDYDYVSLLQQFWYRSPGHFKKSVKKNQIFKILTEIVENGFSSKDVPERYLLHKRDFYENTISCENIIIRHLENLSILC